MDYCHAASTIHTSHKCQRHHLRKPRSVRRRRWAQGRAVERSVAVHQGRECVGALLRTCKPVLMYVAAGDWGPVLQGSSQSRNAPWAPRSGHQFVAVGATTAWLMGGYAGGVTFLNDVWITTDLCTRPARWLLAACSELTIWLPAQPTGTITRRSGVAALGTWLWTFQGRCM